MSKKLANLSFRDQLRIDRFALRLLMMMIGLYGVGFSIAMMIRAGVGVGPWDVFHVAVSQLTGLSVGIVTIMTSFVVLAIWLPLGSRYGIGTVSNAVFVGIFADLSLRFMPHAQGFWLGIAMFLLGIVIHAFSVALYVGAQLGAGPRDGLMTGINRKFGISIATARFTCEAIVCLLGWVLGGPVGVGTILFALLIGPLCQLFIPHLILPVNNLRVPRKK